MEISIAVGGALKKENRIYFFDRNNALICYKSINNNSVSIVSKIKNLPEQFRGFTMYDYSGKLFITSQNSLDVLEYDIESKDYRFILSNISYDASQFFSIQIDDGKIIYVPFELKNVLIIFDLNRRIYEKILINHSAMPHTKRIGGVCADVSYIYISLYKSNKIVKINKKTFESDLIYLEKAKSISNIVCEEEKLWISLSNENALIEYEMGCEKKIQLDNVSVEEKAFSNLIVDGEKIITIPGNYPCFFIYNKKTGDVIRKELNMKNGNVGEGNASLVWETTICDGRIICWPWRYSNIVILNFESLELEYYTPQLSEGDLVYMKWKAKETFLYETFDGNLENFIGSILK